MNFEDEKNLNEHNQLEDCGCNEAQNVTDQSVNFTCPPNTFVYIVQPGDTMFTIARRFGVSLDTLIAINPQIPDPSRIFPGQTICIPETSTPGPCPPNSTVYIVKPGDTMFLIARRFGISLEALVNANPQIPNPNNIKPGQTICVPKEPPAPQCPPGSTRYTVKPGDTMFLIAQRFGISLNALIRANPQVSDPNRIFPGQILCIPPR